MVVLSLYANLFICILGGHMQKLLLKLTLTTEVWANEIYNMLKCFRKANHCVLCKKLQGQQWGDRKKGWEKKSKNEATQVWKP